MPIVTRLYTFCAYIRPRYQVNVYRTIGPLVVIYYIYLSLLKRIEFPSNSFVFRTGLDEKSFGCLSTVLSQCP